MTKVTHEDVIAIIKGTGVKLDWEKLAPKESLADQGADSLDMINIIFAFQEKYGVEITDESISDEEWLTLDKMVLNLNKVLQQK
jgi:acyl carrier protein